MSLRWRGSKERAAIGQTGQYGGVQVTAGPSGAGISIVLQFLL